MASLQPLSHRASLLPSPRLSPSRFPLVLFSNSLVKTSRIFLPSLSFSAPKAFPTSELEVLQAVANSENDFLPCVRTYENDLSRLTLVGAVDFEQALTAAAADGGEAASEHLDSGIPAMVVETVFPGPSDERGTVATRLVSSFFMACVCLPNCSQLSSDFLINSVSMFLSPKKVKEKARKLRRSLNEDFLSSTSSKNILAMTFRQVVLEQLWNFELIICKPGSKRNMEDLENPREVPLSFTLCSSDERVLCVLAEAVCVCVLQSTERHFLENLTSNGFLNWFRKPENIVSKDSSVTIYKLSEDEIVENANSLLEQFRCAKENLKPTKTKLNNYWWTPSAHRKLEKIGGPEFAAWTSEYIPAYKLQLDADQLENLKFEGWRKLTTNRWEVLLTHSQMVGLADILDMFYEDIYSLPNKELSCGVIASSSNLSSKKRISSMLRWLPVTLAAGIFLFTVSAFSQFCLPYLSGKHPVKKHLLRPSSEVEFAQHQSVDAEKTNELCISVVKKIQDAYGWPGNISTEIGIGAWVGELPQYLRMSFDAGWKDEDGRFSSLPSDKIDAEIKASAQEIASYQVVLSTDGTIVGFQPTSRVAVNQWAANPLAKELYDGRKLSPGLMEPGLKIHLPNEVVAIELLMSVKQDACFALARSVR